MKIASTVIANEIFGYHPLGGSMVARNHIGVTAPERVRQAAKKAMELLNG